jgi:hypothetical protein
VLLARKGTRPENVCEAGTDVERINHYPLYELGKALRSLSIQSDADSISARTAYSPLRDGARSIDALLAGTPFPLGISRRAARELRDAIISLFDEFFVKQDDNGKRVVRFPDDKVTIEGGNGH